MIYIISIFAIIWVIACCVGLTILDPPDKLRPTKANRSKE